MNDLISILIQRDGMTREDAYALVQQARAAVAEGADPEEILFDEFGLEPDYLYELL